MDECRRRRGLKGCASPLPRGAMPWRRIISVPRWWRHWRRAIAGKVGRQVAGVVLPRQRRRLAPQRRGIAPDNHMARFAPRVTHGVAATGGSLPHEMGARRRARLAPSGCRRAGLRRMRRRRPAWPRALVVPRRHGRARATRGGCKRQGRRDRRRRDRLVGGKRWLRQAQDRDQGGGGYRHHPKAAGP
jgi:hypothetical protein